MLVYIVKMFRTLSEAAQYMRTAPKDDLRAELLEDGEQMFSQIRSVLKQHQTDLHGDDVLNRLDELEALWSSGDEAMVERLQDFAGELPQELSYRARAVFFAEMGEKWDAMESVYEYMREDPRFDPVIVRTPVGRVVERDGKREQEVIYKDFLTPMGIPSMGYNEYSIEEDSPELAFISQPYESCALEQFWPENIAKHTRLVYLPYFLPSVVLEDYPFVLCQMPVYDLAWKVIGFNQKHYNYYRRYSHHRGANMVVTGVPKTDPIVRCKENPPSLPKGWECIQGKKVFLWNTWFGLDRSSFRYFSEIFAWFKTHENCALIWRPHPMTDTVTKLYSPNNYSYWKECVKAVENAPNAVLDKEVSFIPAFFYSDAMLSDHGSMVQQYLLMDKPLGWFTNSGSSPLTGESFIGCQWQEHTESIGAILSFLNRISQGEDRNSMLRKMVLQQDLSLADGRSGERVCETVWNAMHIEDGLYSG